jgi:hypothetical protein
MISLVLSVLPLSTNTTFLIPFSTVAMGAIHEALKYVTITTVMSSIEWMFVFVLLSIAAFYAVLLTRALGEAFQMQLHFLLRHHTGSKAIATNALNVLAA